MALVAEGFHIKDAAASRDQSEPFAPEGNVIRNPERKEGKRKAPELAVARSSDTRQQIITSSLRLINSQLVIDPNKGRLAVIGRLSPAPSVCLGKSSNALCLQPLVSVGTSSIYQVAFVARELKQHQSLHQHGAGPPCLSGRTATAWGGVLTACVSQKAARLSEYGENAA